MATMMARRRELLLLPWVGRSMRAAAGETHVFKRTGQCELAADVFRAPAEGPRPVIVWIHGGALISGTRHHLRSSRGWQLQRYLDAGFTVVTIDYRLAPETRIDGILEDVRDAIGWVRREAPRLGIDGSRLALAGHSAGGYLTLQMAWSVRPAPRAACSFYGYGDIVGDWYSKPDPFYNKQPKVSEAQAMAVVGKTEIAEPPPGDKRGIFYLYARQNGLWPKLVTGKDPATEAAAFRKWCPVRNVSGRYPPTILLHGDRDTDVPHEMSVEMAAALKRHGVAHELALLPGLGHSFDRPADDPTVSGAFDRAVRFLVKHTR
jgi:acetyl esterase/lipase